MDLGYQLMLDTPDVGDGFYEVPDRIETYFPKSVANRNVANRNVANRNVANRNVANQVSNSNPIPIFRTPSKESRILRGPIYSSLYNITLGYDPNHEDKILRILPRTITDVENGTVRVIKSRKFRQKNRKKKKVSSSSSNDDSIFKWIKTNPIAFSIVLALIIIVGFLLVRTTAANPLILMITPERVAEGKKA